MLVLIGVNTIKLFFVIRLTNLYLQTFIFSETVLLTKQSVNVLISL
jgi:hypothetical protein